MQCIDVWAQVPNKTMAAAPWMKSLMRWTGRTEEELVSTPEHTVQAMDEVGVDLTMLSAWYAPAGPLISNAEVSAQIDAAPDRFRGLLSVDLNRPMEAVRTIREWADGERFVGVRVVPWLWELPPDDRRYYPVYAACVDAGIPFCTQVGHTGPLMTSEPGRPIPYLERVLLEFPELVVVGGHVGFPWIDEIVSLAIKFPNFFVDTSAYALHRLPPAFIDFMKGIGQDRVMFGTNWPMLSPQQCLAHLDALDLSDAQRRAFLSDNAARVFKL